MPSESPLYRDEFACGRPNLLRMSREGGSMKKIALSVCLMNAFAGLVPPSLAQAQTQDTEAAELFAMSQVSEPSVEELQALQDLEQLDEHIRRTRIALLSTTGAFGLGLVLSIAGASQCRDDRFDGDLVCTTTGKALWGIGGSALIGGAVGMITSGILLGLRQRKRRGREREIRTYSERRLHWDLQSARLSF